MLVGVKVIFIIFFDFKHKNYLIVLLKLKLVGVFMKKFVRCHCENCDKQVIAEKNVENHSFHVAMTVLTMGLWAFVLFKAIKNTPANCIVCKNLV